MNYKNLKAKKLVKEAIYQLKQSKKILTLSQILFFSNSLFSSYFPLNLKNADITPVFYKTIVKTLKTTTS